MISVTKRIYVNRTLRNAFEGHLTQTIDNRAPQQGLLSHRTLRPVKTGDPYVIYERWESVAHFGRWQEVTAAQNRLPQAAFDKPTHVEIRRLVASSKLEPEADTSLVSASARVTQRRLHG